jgi:hypothetical protein
MNFSNMFESWKSAGAKLFAVLIVASLALGVMACDEKNKPIL